MYASNKPVFFKSGNIPPPPPVQAPNNDYFKIFKTADGGFFNSSSPLPPPPQSATPAFPYHRPSAPPDTPPQPSRSKSGAASSLGAHGHLQSAYPYPAPHYRPPHQLTSADPVPSPVKTFPIPPPPKLTPEQMGGQYVSYHNNNFNNYYITTPAPYFSGGRDYFPPPHPPPGFYPPADDRAYYEAEEQAEAAAEMGSEANGNPFLNPAAHYPSSRRKQPPRPPLDNSHHQKLEPRTPASEPPPPTFFYMHNPSPDHPNTAPIVKNAGHGYTASPYNAHAAPPAFYYPARPPAAHQNGLDVAKQSYAASHAAFSDGAPPPAFAAGPKKLFAPYGLAKRPPSRLVRPGRRRPRKMFTDAEVNNLIYGVEQFGEGKWARILQCFEFEDRTAVDLKDKWRNLQKPSSTVKVPRHRRTRLPYSEIECRMLRHGVQLFGHNWVEILRAFSFHSERTPVDLKDKWRNLQIKSGLIHAPRKKERRFLLLEAENTVFRNVYPRDAALKAAARGVEYIKLLQVGTPRIHVFAGERRLVHRCAGQERGAVWKGRVQKLGMERATVAQLRVAKAKFATEFGVKDAYEIAPNVKIELCVKGEAAAGWRREDRGGRRDGRVKEEDGEGADGPGEARCEKGEGAGLVKGPFGAYEGRAEEFAVRFKMDGDACYWQKN